MRAEQKESFLTKCFRRGRRFIGRYWGTTEYIACYRSLAEVEPDPQRPDDPFRFFVATPEDIPWMCQYLDEWARWCYGGKQGHTAEEILREQLSAGDIFPIVGAENRPGGALVSIGDICYDEFALRILGDEFKPSREASIRRGWVHPEYRGKRAAGRAMSAVAVEAARRGLKGIWSMVKVKNVPSRALFEWSGYGERGRIRWKVRLNRRYAAVRLDGATKWTVHPVSDDMPHL